MEFPFGAPSDSATLTTQYSTADRNEIDIIFCLETALVIERVQYFIESEVDSLCICPIYVSKSLDQHSDMISPYLYNKDFKTCPAS